MATHFCSKHGRKSIDAELDEFVLIQCNVENSLSTVDRAPSKRNYPSFSSSAENFDFSLTNLGIERFAIAALFPKEIEEGVDSWQKRMKKLIDDNRITLESNSDRSYGVGFTLRFN